MWDLTSHSFENIRETPPKKKKWCTFLSSIASLAMGPRSREARPSLPLQPLVLARKLPEEPKSLLPLPSSGACAHGCIEANLVWRQGATQHVIKEVQTPLPPSALLTCVNAGIERNHISFELLVRHLPQQGTCDLPLLGSSAHTDAGVARHIGPFVCSGTHRQNLKSYLPLLCFLTGADGSTATPCIGAQPSQRHVPKQLKSHLPLPRPITRAYGGVVASTQV